MKRFFFLMAVLCMVASCGSTSNVPNDGPLNISPAAVSVVAVNPAANPSDHITFHIRGGSGPFTVTSSNEGLIASPGSLPEGASAFTVDPKPVNQASTVILSVTDSAGVSAEATVTINFPALSLSAIGSTTISVGVGTTFAINGGVPPFTAAASSDAVTALISRNPVTNLWYVTITGEAAGTAVVTVTDSAITNPADPSQHQSASTPTITVVAGP